MALFEDPATDAIASQDLSADELAIWGAVIIIIGDVITLISLIKASKADKDATIQPSLAKNLSKRRSPSTR